MTEVAEIMAPLGATILGTRSLADADTVLGQSDAAVVLNLSYRAIGLITREDIDEIKRLDPQGWSKKRCAGLVRPIDRPVQRTTTIKELLADTSVNPHRPLLVLDKDEPAGILYPGTMYPATLETWGQETPDQPISGDPMKGSTHNPMKSRVR